MAGGQGPLGSPRDTSTAVPVSAKDEKQQAINRIPVAELDPAWRARVLDVAARAALFRQMGSQMIECEPEFYRFLVEHPEVMQKIDRELREKLNLPPESGSPLPRETGDEKGGNGRKRSDAQGA